MNSTYVHGLFSLFSLTLFFFNLFSFVLSLFRIKQFSTTATITEQRKFVVSCQNNASVSRQCHHEIPWSYTNKEKQRPYKFIGEPIYGNTKLLDPTTQS